MSQILPRLIGPQRSMLMSICGHKVKADQALAWGLVAAVTPDRDSLLPFAIEMARHAAKRDPEINAVFKDLIWKGFAMDHRSGLKMEAEAALESYQSMGREGQGTRERLSGQFGGRRDAKL